MHKKYLNNIYISNIQYFQSKLVIDKFKYKTLHKHFSENFPQHPYYCLTIYKIKSNKFNLWNNSSTPNNDTDLTVKYQWIIMQQQQYTFELSNNVSVPSKAHSNE